MWKYDGNESISIWSSRIASASIYPLDSHGPGHCMFRSDKHRILRAKRRCRWKLRHQSTAHICEAIQSNIEEGFLLSYKCREVSKTAAIYICDLEAVTKILTCWYMNSTGELPGRQRRGRFWALQATHEGKAGIHAYFSLTVIARCE